MLVLSIINLNIHSFDFCIYLHLFMSRLLKIHCDTVKSNPARIDFLCSPAKKERDTMKRRWVGAKPTELTPLPGNGCKMNIFSPPISYYFYRRIKCQFIRSDILRRLFKTTKLSAFLGCCITLGQRFPTCRTWRACSGYVKIITIMAEITKIV